MKKLRFKLEDYARSVAWYFNYFLFRLKHPVLKKIPNKVDSIIIIDLKFIGDLIVDTPMIRALKQKYPNSKISFLLPESMKEIFYNNKNIDKIYTSKEEIKETFDLGILLYPGNKEYSLFLKKIARFRIGIRKSGITEPKGYCLHRKTFPTFKIKHKIEDNLDVIRTINIKTNNKNLELYIKNKKLKYKNYIIIHTVSNTHPTLSKEAFAELADKLKYKKEIIFTGSEKDSDFIKYIQSLMKLSSINLAGKTSLTEYFSLIKNASFVVSIDTSAPHIAAALNVPVVSIFTAGDRRIWHPYSKNSIALQSKNNCTSCMKSKCALKTLECTKIQVNEILDAIQKLYKQ